MNIIIDVGNTRVKYGLFDQRKMIITGEDLSLLKKIMEELKKKGVEMFLLISGTGKIPEHLMSDLELLASASFRNGPALPLPIENTYETPETLGADRISGAVAAAYKYPGRQSLIIDAGTAITYDYVSREGVYLGGNISPGLSMRYRALHEFTERLPLVENSGEYAYFGKNTVAAIRKGVINGMIFEIHGYRDEFLRNYPDGKILLTGGDGCFLRNILNGPFDFDNYLTLKGLNIILEYQKTVNFDCSCNEKED